MRSGTAQEINKDQTLWVALRLRAGSRNTCRVRQCEPFGLVLACPSCVIGPSLRPRPPCLYDTDRTLIPFPLCLSWRARLVAARVDLDPRRPFRHLARPPVRVSPRESGTDRACAHRCACVGKPHSSYRDYVVETSAPPVLTSVLLISRIPALQNSQPPPSGPKSWRCTSARWSCEGPFRRLRERAARC